MSNKSANAIQRIQPPIMKPGADCLTGGSTGKFIEKLTHNLDERIKELNCLYEISRLFEKKDLSLDEILTEVVSLIVPSWQYPEITCARIILEGKEFKTRNFKETPWKQNGDITFDGKRIGALEICYLMEKPQSDEGPFLKEERYLLNIITEQLEHIVERIWAKEALQKRTNDLDERLKELNCLYGISRLVEKSDTSIDKLIKEIINLIPHAWQYPEITCARVVLRGQEFMTDNFQETVWKQSGDIYVHGNVEGVFEIYYLKKRKGGYEGPFLKSEQSLLNVIVERLGRILERIQAKMDFEESEERYRILTESVLDGVTVIRDGNFIFANHTFISMLGFDDEKRLIGKKALDVVSDGFRQHFKELHESVKKGETSEEVFQGKYIKTDGSEFWAETHFNQIMLRGKTAFLHTVRDISEAKLREFAIQEETEKLKQENKRLWISTNERYKFGDIVGKSPCMQKIYNLITKAAASDANIVIYGESGTGKELVARSIYEMSDVYHRNFVPVNCGAIPESIFESEFFGYRKGAFTGAQMDKHGFFDFAHKGTLFLDEVGELTLNMQAKLLRALECGEFTSVGDNEAKKVDTRIVAATNKNIFDMVKSGTLREDFYYRIHIIPIDIPPLRERAEDIPLLIEHLMRLKSSDRIFSKLPGRIMDALSNYDWPGNIRELKNVLQRYLITGHLDFPGKGMFESNSDKSTSINVKTPQEGADYFTKVKSLEKSLIINALEKNKWNKSKVAAELGIPRRTLYRKLKNIETY